jgi:hypothetical protein
MCLDVGRVTAEGLVALTKIETGRKRDKAILEAIRAAIAGWPV